MVAPEEVDAQRLLDEIQRSREDARRDRDSAQAEHERTRHLRVELEEQLAGVDEERRAILEAARQEGQDRVEALRGELETLRRRLAAAQQPLEEMREVREQLDELVEKPSEPEARWSPSPPRRVEPGDRVRVASLGMEGTVVRLDEDEAEIQLGRLRLRVGLEELLEPAQAEAPVGRAASSGSRLEFAAEAPSLEIDLRGEMVEDALEKLERRLDAAFVAGLPFIRVIHGKGTGRLRQAIRQALRRNAYSASFESGSESEGGEGVTIVRLAVG